ncbi:hypothetical protein ACF1BE_19810 [Streptomyces sp. NPDC014991]|uniref:hypothetical protein n=1 Tax=Streptomyces sp. NPDC014991 TaxID=3364935 RepID=UPI0036FB25C5
MTDHTGPQGTQPRARRPYGYRPRLVPTAAGYALGELITMYGDGEIDLETIARILTASDVDGRTMEHNAGGALDALHAQGEISDDTYRRVRDAVERAGGDTE